MLLSLTWVLDLRRRIACILSHPHPLIWTSLSPVLSIRCVFALFDIGLAHANNIHTHSNDLRMEMKMRPMTNVTTLETWTQWGCDTTKQDGNSKRPNPIWSIKYTTWPIQSNATFVTVTQLTCLLRLLCLVVPDLSNAALRLRMVCTISAEASYEHQTSQTDVNSDVLAILGLSASNSYRLLRSDSRWTTSLNVALFLLDCWTATILLMSYDTVLPLSKTFFALLLCGMMWMYPPSMARALALRVTNMGTLR